MYLRYTVPQQSGGKKLLTVLKAEMHLSASLVRRLKQVQAIYADGRPVYTDHVVSPGEEITADLAAAEPVCDVVPESGPVRIIFEDECFLAADKPAGLLVHPSRARYTGTLANYMAGYLQKSVGSGCCHAVNRLDRDTSGVVLFAKNSHGKALASKALAAPDARKEYLALVFGRPDPSGTVDLPIRRLREGDMMRIVAEDGQSAVTHFETVATASYDGADISLLRLVLGTGRTHQIRVHCLAMGCPVLGDILYYTERSRALSQKLGIAGQALHAHRLAFTEPLSGVHLELTAPPPEIFGRFLK
jgi:23S rRNA pseudouridine1911/1915/1917 synthase